MTGVVIVVSGLVFVGYVLTLFVGFVLKLIERKKQ